MTTTEHDVVKVCDAITLAVATGAPDLVRRLRDAGKMDDLCETLRAEAIKLLIPDRDENGQYADAREAVLAGTLHQGYVIGLCAATVIERLRAFDDMESRLRILRSEQTP